MKKQMRVLLGFLFVFGVVGMAFGAPSAMTRDTIVVGTEATYKPLEFRSENNELVGYDIDLVEAVAKKLGKKVEWVDMAFDGLLPALMMHKIDMVAAGMSNTAERMKKVSFSDLTNVSVDGANNPSVFCVLPGNEKNSVSDFEGKMIAVQLGTTQDAYAQKMADVVVKTYQKNDDCLRELLYGRVDAVLINGPVAYEFLQSKDFKGKIVMCAVTTINADNVGDAFAIAKDDPELLEAVNKALAEMKANGEYAALREKWELDEWRKAVKVK